MGKKLPLSPFNDGRSMHVVKYNHLLEQKVKMLEGLIEVTGRLLYESYKQNKITGELIEDALKKIRRQRGR